MTSVSKINHLYTILDQCERSGLLRGEILASFRRRSMPVASSAFGGLITDARNAAPWLRRTDQHQVIRYNPVSKSYYFAKDETEVIGQTDRQMTYVKRHHRGYSRNISCGISGAVQFSEHLMANHIRPRQQCGGGIAIMIDANERLRELFANESTHPAVV